MARRSLKYLSILAAVPLFLSGSLRAAPDAPAAGDGSTGGIRSADAAERPIEPKKFMRFVDDGHNGGKFETAIVTYRNKDGATVRLVGAIHIGERSYYEALNKQFENDDAVLYEMVKPKGSGVPEPGQKSTNPISQLQHLMKDVLDLDFQLDDIDYSKPNFVHADMDAEAFARMQEERGETFQELILKQILHALSNPQDVTKQQQAVAEDPEKMVDDAIEMLTRPDMERQIKLAVARKLDTIEAGAMGLDNPNGSVIVTERNKVALNVLKETLAAGKRRISIFYGAAHMPDMSKRLRDMGFTPVSTEWENAWDLTIRPDQPSATERMLKELLHALDDN
jgi:hypothetical protein